MALTGALKQLRGIASELRQSNVRKRKFLSFFVIFLIECGLILIEYIWNMFDSKLLLGA